MPGDVNAATGDGTTIARIGSLEGHAEVTLEIWVEEGDEHGARELSYWFASPSHASADALARAGDWTFPPHTTQTHVDGEIGTLRHLTPQLDLRWSGNSYYGGFVPGRITSGWRANGLLVTDIAFFFYQTAARFNNRYPARRRPSYRGSAPGEFHAMPSRNSLLSTFRCPRCQAVLLSSESECTECSWPQSERTGLIYESPYDYELSDT